MDAVPSRFWIFQALPERYDLAERLEPGRTENWIVSRFRQEMAEGDVVYMWQAGSEDALFGWATINSDVFEPPPTKSAASSSQASETAQPRVELQYRIRFERPLTRSEIRSDERLKDLSILRTAQGTNFRVRPHEAIALNELARTHGFTPAPDPAPPPGPPSPPPTLSWERLSPGAKNVFAWAAASEDPNPRVGTRGVLIGLVRTAFGGEARELLEYADVKVEDLFEALQQVRPEVRINPTVEERPELTSFPSLTPNGTAMLETAFRLESDPASPIDVRHLFGAILQLESSRASQALERVLDGRVPIETIRATYPTYLQRASTQSYRAFLEERLAGRPSTAITRDAWTDSDQLEHRLYAEAIAEFILDVKTKAPLTIGIKAPWGAGKTSLMRMIRKQLDPQAPDKPSRPVEGSRLTIWEVLRKTWARTPEQASKELEREVTKHRTTIWFNAWKYQSSEQLWAGLAHAILSQVGDRMSPIDCDRLWASIQVRRLRLPELRRGFYRYIALRLLPYVLVAPVAAAGVVVAWAIDPGLLGGASIVGALGSAVSVGTGFVRSAKDEVTKAIPQLVEEPDYGSRLGFLHLVDSDMHRILEVAGATAEDPFVIFVDDLDRCSYTTVAQVIEALNVFLAGDFDNCIFVIAMEPDLVAAQIHIAYEKLFERLGEDGDGDLGWRFLEKMVQLPLALPEPQRPQVERFLDSILAVEAQALIPEVPDDAAEVEETRAEMRELETDGTLEGIPDAMEELRTRAREAGTATPYYEAVLQRAARLEFKDRFSDAHARAMLMQHAADLSGNPREIKRFINVFRFYAYVDFWRRTQELPHPGLDGAGKLARIAIGWPSLLSTLAREVSDNGKHASLLTFLEAASGDDKEWARCVKLAPARSRAQISRPELRAVIAQEPHVGETIAGFL